FGPINASTSSSIMRYSIVRPAAVQSEYIPCRRVSRSSSIANATCTEPLALVPDRSFDSALLFVDAFPLPWYPDIGGFLPLVIWLPNHVLPRSGGRPPPQFPRQLGHPPKSTAPDDRRSQIGAVAYGPLHAIPFVSATPPTRCPIDRLPGSRSGRPC